MPGRLIIEGNSVYEIDEECMERQKERKRDCSVSAGGSCVVRCQKGRRENPVRR